MLSSQSTHTPHGSFSWPSAAPQHPIVCRKARENLKAVLDVSATMMFPDEFTHTPDGSLNWPCAAPPVPNLRTNVPSGHTTWTRLLMQSACSRGPRTAPPDGQTGGFQSPRGRTYAKKQLQRGQRHKSGLAGCEQNKQRPPHWSDHASSAAVRICSISCCGCESEWSEILSPSP
eukprot:gnl/Spiro4/16583_TR8926_c0_g1_i1.p1 gnl/Spiro4/16583_TR8926_c0_g1~~gnl/Spiro4/16583_TR8926_c0_g1_i1.p1  ORF type:complete len:174 (-),score=6.17 gnl/Spiro4/16583_TR8926_c0_g1_i1:49-570(-)